ncbi:M56 family metallopeptidase [Planctomyces sp. SH-PL14]|uniref:M56 family metallopeptidase n=1 Tax=Planctomyces sp. SH-PL14 TaxID=1632864 RepID=UPI00078B2A91|nr:M56 family metallopeptidase [Planctomyces sp. SH-PL14]AMV16930.1 Regulatory protein BlaR1 [Planctomyces sp. SH-PL14]
MTVDWTILILRASGMLLIAGCFAWLLQRWRPVADSRWHRVAWGLVLLQGVLVAPFSLALQAPAWWAFSHSEPTVSSSPDSEAATAGLASSVPVTSRPTTASSASTPTGGHEASVTRAVEAPFENLSTPFAALAPETASPLSLPETISAAGSGSALPNEMRSTPVRPETLDQTAEAPAAASIDPSRPAAASIDWRRMLVGGWAGGAALVLATLLFHFGCVRLALANASPARSAWTKELQELGLELGLRRDVRLMVHPQVGPFLTWAPGGYRIVVPVRLWNRLSAEERKAVLHHELCHLRRGDLWASLVARAVVALHWFNPLAWYAASRFDEAAEWSCDALMAEESPVRAPRLAQALLAVAQVGARSPLMATAATGGPLFQRIRRLVADREGGDSWMQRGLWTGTLLAVGLAGLVDLRFVAPAALAAAPGPGSASVSQEVDEERSSARESVTAAPSGAPHDRLEEFASRIVVKENEPLRKFVALLRTPAGQILMADRAAIQAQNAAPEGDSATQWERFVARHFRKQDGKWNVVPEQGEVIDRYVREIEAATADLSPIGLVLIEIAGELDEKHSLTPVLKRFLTHEAAPAFLYQQELRLRLHPEIDNILDGLDQALVRTRTGAYVIRPARQTQVERRLKTIDEVHPVLARYQEELAAWSRDLVKTDDLHRRFSTLLADPLFAKYWIAGHASEDAPLKDESVEEIFNLLEDATSDTAEGLKFDVETDAFKALEESAQRYDAIVKYREALETPLHQLAGKIDGADPLQAKLSKLLGTELAFMLVARKMDYLPVTADAAAREWMAQFVTKNPQGNYEITTESPDDLKGRAEEFFRQARDVRRRGRVVDEFAAEVTNPALSRAMTSLVGKLELARLAEVTAERPEVDGLQLWFGELFAETPDGLVLQDWAGPSIEELLQEAAEIEKELKKADF